jgi:uncharacterized protein with ParB-like and HNH nuclease domain
MKNNTLVSGSEYSIRDLLNGNYKIVIPDLQRDYCWGLETYNNKYGKQGELVTQFLEAIINSYKGFVSKESNEYLTLGIVYGYESPKGQIQLCDGQQRVTTLFLLLGVLNRKLGDNSLQEDLITDYELNEDDKEPNLLYAIRESTLYFLSDLVCKYFLSSNSPDFNFSNPNDFPPVLELDGRPEWYFSEYDEDMSIQSMLGAIMRMDKVLKDNEDKINIRDFANYVLNNLKVIYYDMGNRLNGEETFVVINTTGEPLSASENLKPILIGGIEEIKKREDYSDEWEEREKWFWENRNEKKENTSDALSFEFYKWFWQIRRKQENVTPRKLFIEQIKKGDSLYPLLDDIHRCFEGLKCFINELNNNESLKKVISCAVGKINDSYLDELRKQSNMDLLLPFIRFSMMKDDFCKSNFNSNLLTFARRIVKNHLNGSLGRNKESSYLPFRDIITIIDKSRSFEDLMTYDDSTVGIQNVKAWFNEDEAKKMSYFDELPIIDWEMSSFLQFDLSIIWDGEQGSLDYYKRRYANLKQLNDVLSNGNKNPILYNLYITYRVFNEWGDQVGHVSYRSWDAQGRYINWHDYMNDFMHCYEDKGFSCILDSKDIKKDLAINISAFVNKNNLLNLNSDNFSPNLFIKAWVFSKMLICNNLEITMASASWDYEALGVYMEADRNKLNKNIPFSLYNASPGYIKRDWVNRKCSRNISWLDIPLYYDNSIDINDEEFVKQEVPETYINMMNVNINNLFEKFEKGVCE